jgi:hypothetical protein
VERYQSLKTYKQDFLFKLVFHQMDKPSLY